MRHRRGRQYSKLLLLVLAFILIIIFSLPSYVDGASGSAVNIERTRIPPGGESVVRLYDHHKHGCFNIEADMEVNVYTMVRRHDLRSSGGISVGYRNNGGSGTTSGGDEGDDGLMLEMACNRTTACCFDPLSVVVVENLGSTTVDVDYWRTLNCIDTSTEISIGVATVALVMVIVTVAVVTGFATRYSSSPSDRGYVGLHGGPY